MTLQVIHHNLSIGITLLFKKNKTLVLLVVYLTIHLYKYNFILVSYLIN